MNRSLIKSKVSASRKVSEAVNYICSRGIEQTVVCASGIFPTNYILSALFLILKLVLKPWYVLCCINCKLSLFECILSQRDEIQYFHFLTTQFPTETFICPIVTKCRITCWQSAVFYRLWQPLHGSYNQPFAVVMSLYTGTHVILDVVKKVFLFRQVRCIRHSTCFSPMS